jgi:propanol-preferring alcohol dehydrogenase
LYSACGCCDYCITGWETLCEGQQNGAYMHGVLVTAVSPIAFKQGIAALRRKGAISLNGLPPGSFDLPIFETVLNRYTVRGSIMGTRKDMQEAISFAMEGKVKATVHAAKLEDINTIFDNN